MRVHFKPKTTLGKWSAWLIVAYAVVLVAFEPILRWKSVGETFLGSLFFTSMSYPALPLGMAAFITGLISILRCKERSIAVYLAVIFGVIGPISWTVGMIIWLSSVNH